MAGRVDLHLHTTASDGKYRPAEVVRRAAGLGLSVIAIADHDSVDGIAPALAAAKSFPGLTVIPCLEVSTDVPRGEVHILGYFIDYTSAELNAALAHFRDSREGRAKGMIDKLSGMGINIEWRRVKEIAGEGSVGRPHIAQAMLEKGYITSFKEAFDKYIAREGPAYVEREKMMPAEAVKLRIGSAFPLEPELTMPIKGRDMVAGLPRTVEVSSEEIREALAEPVRLIAEKICSVLEETPPELSSDIIERGIVLTGGGALLRGLDELLSKVTQIPVRVADNALHCVAVGTGRALEHLDEIEQSGAVTRM
ncbi:MAG: rod shape-determining protein [Chloroflexi bacterium]|nr:rod shape-determining protein [Chloroflexota bacterium]